ncbi:MAG: cvaB, partial [Marmoricola sp.]|nr:cvaB [Marmoricola sp.]
SAHFTGVALELWPTQGFKPHTEKQTVRLSTMLGRVQGLWRSFGQILLLAIAMEVFGLVHPFFLQWLVDDVVVAADYDLLLTLALGFGLLMLMQQIVTAVRSWAVMTMTTWVSVQWRANVFSHLIRLPVQYFEKRHLGDVMSRFGSIDQIQHTLTNSFLEAILDGLMAVATLVMMFAFSPMLAWIAIATMTLYALTRSAWYRPLRAATEEQINHAAKQQTHFLETIRGVKTIKLFQRQDQRRSVWLAMLIDQINAELRTQKLQVFYKLLNGILFGLENILILAVGAKMVLSGNFSVGLLIAFNAYKTQFDSRIGSLIDKFFEFKMLQLQTQRLGDIILTEAESLGEVPDRLPDQNDKVSIEVRRLHFRYSRHEPYILNGVSFRIESGESVAIVGVSGCGKTTLMNVLLGILPPTEGEVLIGEINVKTIGIDSLRQLVGTVLQDDVLFAGSIADNISFFDPEPDRVWVEQCAYFASIALEIRAMPMQYNTLIGDMGTILSGGQKQRILLARALYKRPRILFLDEATSHLDIEKEKQVNTAINALKITRVIVAHRPETIASADRVIELSNGMIKPVCSSPIPGGKLTEIPV